MRRLAEVGFEARYVGQGGVDQTLGLDNVESRSRTGFKLKLGQIQCFTAGSQVMAGDRQTLLIIAYVDVSRGNRGNQRQALNVDA